MSGEIPMPAAAVLAFALVAARVAGAVAFVPIPGLRTAPLVPKIVLTLTLTAALSPVWTPIRIAPASPSVLILWTLSELAFGLTVGVAIAFLNEGFVLASQIFGLQAGYGYASTIDPATQADSSVLQLLAHLSTGLLFFALGLDREVIRVFAQSLERFPPGAYAPGAVSAGQVLSLGGVMFATAVKMALPVVALMTLVDISLALLGRINSQLPLLMLAFPAKMLISIGVLAATAALMPELYRSAAVFTWQRFGLLLASNP